jgi:cytochrome P450
MGDTKPEVAENYGWGTPEFTSCPYPFYSRLHQEAPVFHIPGTKTYLLTRWADIAYVTQNVKLFVQAPNEFKPAFEVDFPTVELYSPQAVPHTNGSEHKIKRAWVQRLVERERLRTYEPLIRNITDELIDGFISNGQCEFRWDFAEKLPAYVMMDLLGLPREDAQLFMVDEVPPAERGAHKQQEFEYVFNAIADRLEDPKGDFLSEILYDQIDKDGGVDINFQVAQGTNLILAGSETTAHLLMNTMAMLCRSPGLQGRVRGDRSLLRPLIEESMRLESPVQWAPPRIATRNAVVGGVEIPAGATLWLLLGAANRDPEKWENPDTLRLERPNLAQEQLGFGRGPHLCIGAPLARLEALIAFDRLLTRLEDFYAVDQSSDLTNVMKAPPPQREGVFDSSGTMHGPKTLVVRFETGDG